MLTKEDCIKLLIERSVPTHIIKHSIRVYQVASFIGRELIKKGITLNITEIEIGALLHDICKIEGILTKKDHALLASNLLKEMGYKSISEIVRQHVRLDDINNHYTEATIVNYSDKRVKHDEIVTLEIRFIDLIDRYAKTKEDVRKFVLNYQNSKRIEHSFFSLIDLSPDVVNTLNQHDVNKYLNLDF